METVVVGSFGLCDVCPIVDHLQRFEGAQHRLGGIIAARKGGAKAVGCAVM
jgi:hypothetical protein